MVFGFMGGGQQEGLVGRCPAWTIHERIDREGTAFQPCRQAPPTIRALASEVVSVGVVYRRNSLTQRLALSG